MNHRTEEDLVLYHYGESPEGAAIEEHLASCPACRSELEALRQLFRAIESTPVPERDEEYASRVWERMRWRLRGERSWWGGLPSHRRWAALGAVAAMLALAFISGLLLNRSALSFSPTIAQAPVPPQARERVLVAFIGDHLDKTEMVLLELVNTNPTSSGDLADIESTADELVSANRMYRQTASRNGESGVASVLDEIEPILLEMAHGGSDPDRLTELRRRIEAKGILFKMRVVNSQMRERQQEAARQLSGRV